MKQLYHIEPVFTEALWGGQQLIEKYGYQTDLANIGECYNVIAMPSHLDCTVTETQEPLSHFYDTHRELFNCDTEIMPVRAAMSCTRAPMSVQIHPDNAYAMAHDGRLGKPDGVYVLDGEGSVVFGHFARTRREFQSLVEEQRWNQLLRYIPVKAGDFLDMPFGTLHALGAGLTFFEFSQNADLTYRLYDYDRTMLDPKTGKPRVLHQEKVIECVNIPDAERKPALQKAWTTKGCEIHELHNEPGLYTCGRIDVAESGTYKREEFYFLTCIEGEGTIQDTYIKGGETVFVPCHYGELTITGTLSLTYVTYIKP